MEGSKVKLAENRLNLGQFHSTLPYFPRSKQITSVVCLTPRIISTPSAQVTQTKLCNESYETHTHTHTHKISKNLNLELDFEDIEFYTKLDFVKIEFQKQKYFAK